MMIFFTKMCLFIKKISFRIILFKIWSKWCALAPKTITLKIGLKFSSFISSNFAETMPILPFLLAESKFFYFFRIFFQIFSEFCNYVLHFLKSFSSTIFKSSFRLKSAKTCCPLWSYI